MFSTTEVLIDEEYDGTADGCVLGLAVGWSGVDATPIT